MMERRPIPTWFFVVVVVRLGHRFLLVQERKHNQAWYLPAGRVELGETLVEAAQRETMEEAEIPIVPEGILRIEHTPFPDATRVRVILVARPADDSAPLSKPNEDSLLAKWVTVNEAQELPLRGGEVLQIMNRVLHDTTVYPLSLLAKEGDRY